MKRGKASILPVLFVLITAMLCPGPAFAVSAQSLPDGDSLSAQETASSPSAPESFPESSVPASSQPPLPDVPPQESTEPSSEPVPQESIAAPTNPEDVSLPETPSEPALSPTSPSVDAPSQAPESPEEGSPAESQESAPLTVAQALALPAVSTSVTVRGIVVFTEGPQIVIQDDTGGMRVSFSLAAPLNAGDLVTITGRPIGSFFGESWTVEGTAPLPAVSSTLAQAPENLVRQWQKMIFTYLQGRVNLKRVFLLIDSRHGIKKVDEEIMKMLDAAAVTYQIVLTKTDKISARELQKIISETNEKIKKHGAAHIRLLATSSEKKQGLEELRAEIAGIAQ